MSDKVTQTDYQPISDEEIARMRAVIAEFNKMPGKPDSGLTTEDD